MDADLKTEQTKAGLKIYWRLDKDSEFIHIKTIKCKYEPLITGMDWIKDFKRILPTKEERLYLEMKYQIWNINWANTAQRDFVNKQEVVCVRRIEPRNSAAYYVVVMSEGTEVMCSRIAYTTACNLGIKVESIKRL